MPRKSSSRARKRPGGRSSRVRSAVFAAAEELLARRPGDLPSMAEIAARAGVNPTSLYRRWRDAKTLIAEVAVERLMRDNPLPDTGSLREDLIGWATAAAQGLSTRRNVLLLRILTATPPLRRGAPFDLDALPIGRRGRQLESLLARAADRGERAPSLLDVMELVLAPIYLHAFFIGPIDDVRGVDRLVDRALALASA